MPGNDEYDALINQSIDVLNKDSEFKGAGVGKKPEKKKKPVTTSKSPIVPILCGLSVLSLGLYLLLKNDADAAATQATADQARVEQLIANSDSPETVGAMNAFVSRLIDVRRPVNGGELETVVNRLRKNLEDSKDGREAAKNFSKLEKTERGFRVVTAQ